MRRAIVYPRLPQDAGSLQVTYRHAALFPPLVPWCALHLQDLARRTGAVVDIDRGIEIHHRRFVGVELLGRRWLAADSANRSTGGPRLAQRPCNVLSAPVQVWRKGQMVRALRQSSCSQRLPAVGGAFPDCCG